MILVNLLMVRFGLLPSFPLSAYKDTKILSTKINANKSPMVLLYQQYVPLYQ